MTSLTAPCSKPETRSPADMRLVHPIIDEWGEEFALFSCADAVVRLTEPFVGFLGAAADEGRHPVLVTPVWSRVTAQVSLAMRRAGGRWIGQKPSGESYDALTGYRIERVSDVWAPPAGPRARLATFDGPRPGLQQALTFDVHAHYRAVESTVIGQLAGEAVRGLGSSLDSWGSCEPLLSRWDTQAITAQVKASMPESGVALGSGPGGSFVTVQVARTKTGLLEHTQGGVLVPDGSPRLVEYVDEATRLLERVAGEFQVTLAFVSLSQWDAGMTQRVRARAPESPLAVLIGAKGVRDLGLDVAELAAAHDVVVVGRAKTPSVIVRFADTSRGLWDQLAQFASTLDPARIATAAGMTNAPTAGGGA